MAGYRPTTQRDGTVVQGSTMVDSAEYKHFQISKFFLGVILDVFPSDSEQNRSAQQTEDRKGHRHECSVFIVDDGSSGYTVLENVVITPDSPSGLDDYEERLPRGSFNKVDGGEYDVNLAQVDPYDLDGDWCVIGFLGGRIDSPFVIRWWPNTRNTFDPATSGNAEGATALLQNRRYFRRINGIETVINSLGDITVSTTLASASLAHGGDPYRGRYPRNPSPEVGGSVRLYVKPTQTFEIDFNPQQDGIGVNDAPDEELPQTNPPQTDPEAENTGELPAETFVLVDRKTANIYVPVSVTIVSQDQMLVQATNFVSITTEDYIDLTATNQITLEAEKLYLGQAAEDSEEDPVILGEKHRTWLRDVCVVLSPFGPLKIDPATLLTPYDDTQSVKSFVE